MSDMHRYSIRFTKEVVIDVDAEDEFQAIQIILSEGSEKIRDMPLSLIEMKMIGNLNV